MAIAKPDAETATPTTLKSVFKKGIQLKPEPKKVNFFSTSDELKQKFRDHVKDEFSTENLEFLEKIYQLYSEEKNLKNRVFNFFSPERGKEQAAKLNRKLNELYDEFIDPKAAKQVNLPADIVGELRNKKPKEENNNEENQNENPQIAWKLEDFANASEEIRRLVNTDSAKRFRAKDNNSHQPSTNSELKQSLVQRLQRLVTGTIAKSGSKQAEQSDSPSVKPSTSGWMLTLRRRKPRASLSQEKKLSVPPESTAPPVSEVTSQQSKPHP